MAEIVSEKKQQRIQVVSLSPERCESIKLSVSQTWMTFSLSLVCVSKSDSFRLRGLTLPPRRNATI